MQTAKRVHPKGVENEKCWERVCGACYLVSEQSDCLSKWKDNRCISALLHYYSIRNASVPIHFDFSFSLSTLIWSALYSSSQLITITRDSLTTGRKAILSLHNLPSTGAFVSPFYLLPSICSHFETQTVKTLWMHFQKMFSLHEHHFTVCVLNCKTSVVCAEILLQLKKGRHWECRKEKQIMWIQFDRLSIDANTAIIIEMNESWQCNWKGEGKQVKVDAKHTQWNNVLANGK